MNSKKLLSKEQFGKEYNMIEEACRQWYHFIFEDEERIDGVGFSDFYEQLWNEKYEDYLEHPNEYEFGRFPHPIVMFFNRDEAETVNEAIKSVLRKTEIGNAALQSISENFKDKINKQDMYMQKDLNEDNTPMTYKEMQEIIGSVIEEYDPEYIHTSPDFQCDQTGGFPTTLCVCYEKGVAWLELREDLITDKDEMELDYYRRLCADYGIRTCYDNEQFNELLKELGEDAYNAAYFPDEDEDMGMVGM